MGYTTPYANASSSTPQLLAGYLGAGLEITVLSAVACSTANPCAFSRGVALHGWAGDKIVVVETSMPTSATQDIPAIWTLNANIVRSAQYGCNCHASGCGEFDIAEIINMNADRNKLYMTLYSYNGNAGTPAYFARPTGMTTYRTYLTHFSVSGNRIFALDLPPGCFKYGASVPAASIAQLEATAVNATTFASNPNTNSVFNCPST